jgi:2-hydroxy-6-oxonona-2,4-dienedioate hydrolase
MTMPTSDRESRYREAERALWDSLGVRPKESSLRLATLDTDVRVVEFGIGPPILFIHGGSTCGTSWAELAAALPEFRCILVDRPGTGLSPPFPRPIDRLEVLEDVADLLIEDVLVALGLHAAAVVATSFGGWFALRAALATPERLRRLVMFGWSAGAPVDRLPVMLRLGVMPRVGGILDRMPVNDRAVRAIFRGIGSGPALDDGRISAEALSAYGALLRWTPTLRNDRSLGRFFFSARGVDVVLTPDERARISTPIDWLWGGRDVFGGESIARRFVAPFPEVRLTIVPDAGHAPWVDDVASATAFVRTALARA